MNITSLLHGSLSYPAIFILMLLESTVVPVPSEFVVTPAAYAAAASTPWGILPIIVVATLGADVGASINYFVALYVGRPVVYRFAASNLGRLCLLSEAKIDKSERYFTDHGAAATLTGRFVPVIRHLISIPAGLSRMNYGRFLLFTTIGAGGWHTVLALLGLYMHSVVPEDQLGAAISHYSEYIKVGILVVLLTACIFFFVRRSLVKRLQKNQKN